MATYSDLARVMAHQMLDRSALSIGVFKETPRHANGPVRTVTMRFKMPSKIPFETRTSFERHLQMQIPNPDRKGHVNVSWPLPRDETASLPFQVSVSFSVATFSTLFFRSTDKKRFIDRHAWHLVAKAVSRDLSGKDAKQLSRKLSKQFPDKRHPFDRFLRRTCQRIADKTSEIWWELKPLPRDKYRNYR